MEENPKPLKVKSAWANGSFYLFVFVVAVGGIGFLGRTGIIFPGFLCSSDWWSFTCSDHSCITT
jgi:hypothetical protein